MQIDVDRLKEKTDLAEFIRDVLNSPGENVSFDEMFNDNEQKDKETRIIDIVSEEYINSGWSEIVYAKNILKNKYDVHRFKKAYQIYEYILKRDFIDIDNQLKALIYHLLGQLLWKYCIKFMIDEKVDSKYPDKDAKICNIQPIGCTPSWISQCDNNFDKKECLERSIYYLKNHYQ